MALASNLRVNFEFQTVRELGKLMRRSGIMVFAGDFRSGSSERGLADGFRKLGWAVHEVDRRNFGAIGGRSLLVRGIARLARRKVEAEFCDAILQACRELQPDVLFTVKGTGLTGPMLEEAGIGGARVVMYYPDLAFNHAGIDQSSFSAYHLFVTTKTFQVPWLQDRLGPPRVAYVPHGYVDATHQPVTTSMEECDYRFDVLYAGNHSSYKQRWLSELLEFRPGTDLAIVGNRWREQQPRVAIRDGAFLGEQQGVGYAMAIQLARINVAFHFGTTNSDWQDLVSTRTFEIPACGGFMLHIDNEEVREFFEPGVEIDVFSCAEELSEKVQFYLQRPELRARMIERAYQRCVPAYGYVRRAAQVHDVLTARGLLKSVAQGGVLQATGDVRHHATELRSPAGHPGHP